VHVDDDSGAVADVDPKRRRTMMKTDAYVEVLSRNECLRLLPSSPIARIAYCSGGEAHLFPVNATAVVSGRRISRPTA
jgi:hypothetical protein